LNFTIDEVYKRSEIHLQYGGQGQGGISTPADHNLILLFTGESGEQYGYSDGWTDEGAFLYTGEGQIGDMEFVRGNRAILSHTANGNGLHLFEVLQKGFVRYLGQMVCLGFHFRQGLDREEHSRQLIVFELAPASLTSENSESSKKTSSTEATIIDLSLSFLRRKAIEHASESATAAERKIIVRVRSVAIKLYALKRSNGICEGCDQPAPFFTANKQPYLEAHHIHRLADGGADHPNSVVALCPNCHRRAHYAEDGKQFNDYLDKVAQKLEMLNTHD
jgi:5-methylcytosine-specific restriction enzyme A